MSFLDVYENGGLDFLVTYQSKNSQFHTKVYKNELVLENAFLKVSGRLYFTRDFFQLISSQGSFTITRECIGLKLVDRYINPFFPNAPFLYLLKTSENRTV